MAKQQTFAQFMHMARQARQGYLFKFKERTSCLRNLVPALRNDITNNNLSRARFNQLRTALEQRSPKDSRKYQAALDYVVANWTWARPPLPPPRRRPQIPLIMGMAHPTRTRQRRDEVIADTGQVYRTYRQSKSHSCGPTCCLIVVMNYFHNVQYSEQDMREHLGNYIGGYRPYGGTGMEALASLLNSADDFTATFRTYTTYQELRDATPRISGQLYPAIIRIQWGPNGGGHFIVVAETVGDKFMVLDPLKGHVQPLTEDGLSNYNNAGYWDGNIVTSF